MKNVHRVKSAPHVPHALHVKIASRVASVKNACVNCVSLWTRHLPLPLPQPLAPKIARPASRVKNAHHAKSANRARHVKSVNHAPSKPLLPPKKKY